MHTLRGRDAVLAEGTIAILRGQLSWVDFLDATEVATRILQC
jgi:hypothetical protein